MKLRFLLSLAIVTLFATHNLFAGLQISPDGKQLLVGSVPVHSAMARAGSCEAWIVDVESGKKRRLEAGDDAYHGAWAPDGQHLAFSRMATKQGKGLFTVPSKGGPPNKLSEGKAGWGAALSL